MKRAALLIAGLLVVVLLVAAACGGDDDEQPTSRPAATTAPATTQAPTAPPAAAGAALEIGVNDNALAFNQDSYTVSAGSEVTMTFTNVSSINSHNWAVVTDGTKDDVAVRGTAAGPASDWIQPGDADVIANTKLLLPGETGDVTFTAPAPGTYQFVCTFPGHNFTMFGSFEVSG